MLLAGWHSKGYPRGRVERLGLWSRREAPPGTLVPRGGSPQEHPLPRRILLESLASKEDPPGRILPGARTSKEYAPGSSLLRGQSSSETLSPERTPPGGLDSCEPTAPVSFLCSVVFPHKVLRDARSCTEESRKAKGL